jgi:hypothetical protein
MRASLEGRDELAVRVQTALSLPTKKEAEHIVNVVIQSLETHVLAALRESSIINCSAIADISHDFKLPLIEPLAHGIQRVGFYSFPEPGLISN